MLYFSVLAAQGFEEWWRVGASAVLRVGVRVVVVVVMIVSVLAIVVVFQVAVAARRTAFVRIIED